MAKKLTLSVIKADIGGYVGHSSFHPELLAEAGRCLEAAKKQALVVDCHVARVGDDLELIMTHERGVDSPEIHQMAWETFQRCTEIAKRLKLYAAGQDLLSDAFTGTVRGMGPGIAEMEFEERRSEPVIVFMADNTAAGAWNLPLVKIFADPFNTIGLVISPEMHGGYRFRIHDVQEGRTITLDCPEEYYDLLVLVGAVGRYIIQSIYHRATGQIAAVSSTQRLSLMAGRYVGKDDPVCVVRCQSIFPAVGEVLEPFCFPYLVEGWMRGSHHGPLMPVRQEEANPSRFDGPPRVIALGFQVSNGQLIGPLDMFADPAFDEARHQCNLIADYFRRHGPFEPHRLPLDEMEYTTLPAVMKRLEGRFQ